VVPQTMNAVDAGLRRLRFEPIELVPVRHLGRNQTAGACKLLGFLQ
jgi:polysaccharide deacetylase 2 family uncharacterized protein YibQ